MSFLNRYNKAGEYEYFNSKRVGDAIYSIGYIEDVYASNSRRGLIIKTNLEGELIWEKSYEYTGYNFTFINLIACNNNDILVTATSDYYTSSFLLRIGSNGNIIWSKYFPQLNTDYNYGYEPNLISIKGVNPNEENYILVLGDDSNGYFVYKIDSTGSIVIQQSISSNDGSAFSFRGITSNTDRIAVYGGIAGAPYQGIVFELDFSLNQIIRKLKLNSVIDQFQYQGTFCITNTSDIFGINSVFFTKTDIQTLDHITSQISFLPLETAIGIQVKFNNNFIYIENYDREKSIITKIDYNFQVKWTKKYTYIHPHYSNGVLQQLTNKEIIIVDGGSIDGGTVSGAIGLLDLNLNSCRTINEDEIYIRYKGLELEESDANFILSNTNFQVIDGDSLTITLITPVKEEMCTFTNDPCIKDQSICDLYNQLSTIFTDCLVSPDMVDNTFDFSTINACMSLFLDTLGNFDSENPDYHLDSNLNLQILIIKNTIGNLDYINYTTCYNAIEIILDYLSQLGNCECNDNVYITDYASIQSPDFYLQSAGSTGNDSTPGIHLRWLLKGALDSHLPKANYAIPNINFNKKDDFVKIYRTVYQENKVSLNLGITPNIIEDADPEKIYWVYNVDDKVFYIHFRDSARYDQAKSIYTDPGSNTLDFLQEYGDGILEIENKTELSFAITPYFTIITEDVGVKIELLTVEENKISAPKQASLRKLYVISEINQIKLVSENIRSIRLLSPGAFLQQLEFEFYSDFIRNTADNNQWSFLGKHALTKNTDVAFKRLEPQPDALLNWQRYNDDAFVNVDNYKTKWSGNTVLQDEGIIDTVKEYIELSNNASNPLAIKIINPSDYIDNDAIASCMAENSSYDPYPETDEETAADFANEISLLELLQISSLDYHIARMLGLGTLDMIKDEQQYIYLAEYITFANLNDGLGARQVQHLYCSLPTSIYDQRLPIPVDLYPPTVGAYYDHDYEVETDPDADPDTQPQNNQEMTVDGYTSDGMSRYYTLTNVSLPEELENQDFFYKPDEFISAERTIPVFAGIEYKRIDDEQWRKPELSFDNEYFNRDITGYGSAQETLPIIIPDPGKTLHTHRERSTGIQIFSSYGINWFSRAVSSTLEHSVETHIVPKDLLSPTNVSATLISKENPLLLTSAIEQKMLTNNTRDDKTIVRLTFDYNHIQELKIYHQKINGELIEDYSEPDIRSELFADDIQIFFRNQVPNTVLGKVKNIGIISGEPMLRIIDTAPYSAISSGLDETVIPQTNPPTYNETFVPEIPTGYENNFKGSIMLIDEIEYVIYSVDNSSQYPKFTIFLNDSNGGEVNLNTIINPSAPLRIPTIGSLFLVVENMLTVESWMTPNPDPSFSIKIDHIDVHREEDIIIENVDCTTDTYVQKFRGIYELAHIEKIKEKVYLNQNEDGDDNLDNDAYIEKHLGLYKVTFSNFHLAQHSQYFEDNNNLGQGGNSVEWYNGILRLHTVNNTGERKDFQVVRTENIGTGNNLVLYISDSTFPTDELELIDYKDKLMLDNATSINQTVNYYPGYKVYLYEDAAFGLNEENVLPLEGHDSRYTIFGLRSHDKPAEFIENNIIFDNTVDIYSKISVPQIMFSQVIEEPERPQLPSGGMYATRPDFFGKSSYTFTTIYKHKPHSVQFNRASDIQFLSSIYKPETINIITNDIFIQGEESFYVDRWQNLLSFDYIYTDNSDNINGQFKFFKGQQLPLPDSLNFIASINVFIDAHNAFYKNLPSAVPHITGTITNLYNVVIPKEVVNGIVRNEELTICNFLKDILLNCFVPLTEIPVIYDYIKPHPYKPIPKKQVIRDRNGNLLMPTFNPNSEFDMAPMMKRMIEEFKTQFTDFGLDGASNAKYFYAVREVSQQLKMSEYSPICGPVSLVNTAPPTAPEVIKIIPILENRVLGTIPAIQLQINAYSTVQHITKINIYRTFNPVDSLSVRTMTMVKEVDIENAGLTNESKWVFTDDFSDVAEIPYGDPLYYKLTVSRLIKYNDKDYDSAIVDNLPIIDYAPSEASKLVITNIVENYSPESPVLNYTSDLILSNSHIEHVILNWNKTTYKGKYHLYKMNSQGNWVKIAEVSSNQETISIPLEETELGVNFLSMWTENGDPIYHSFKVIAENTAGMYSKAENILTIKIDPWDYIDGINDPLENKGMIVGETFIIRPNN